MSSLILNDMQENCYCCGIWVPTHFLSPSQPATAPKQKNIPNFNSTNMNNKTSNLLHTSPSGPPAMKKVNPIWEDCVPKIPKQSADHKEWSCLVFTTNPISKTINKGRRKESITYTSKNAISDEILTDMRKALAPRWFQKGKEEPKLSGRTRSYIDFPGGPRDSWKLFRLQSEFKAEKEVKLRAKGEKGGERG